MIETWIEPQLRAWTARLAALLVIGGGLAVPADVDAQYYRYSAGFVTGGNHVTDLNSDAPGDARALSPGVGAVFGLYADRWYGSDGRMGLRLQGAYQQSTFDWAQGERRIGVGSADASGLLRLIRPDAAGSALPYVTAGVGGIWYDLGTGDSTFFQEADAFHDGRSRVLPQVMVGAGVDVEVPWGWQSAPVRLRAEIADHIAIGSPIHQVSSGNRHGAVHHIRFSIGLHSMFDFQR